MQKFDNHAPINFDNATELTSASRDGGAYDGIGYNDYLIMQGRMIHVWHRHSSGCEYNNRTDRRREYLFGCRTKEELIAWLLGQLAKQHEYDDLPYDGLTVPIWACNELLEDLGYAGAPA